MTQDLTSSDTGLSQQQNSASLAGISHPELVHGVPNSETVRKAFRLPATADDSMTGRRGACNAADHEDPSINKVARHLVKRLKTSRGIQVSKVDFLYDDWQADIHGIFYRFVLHKKYARYLLP